MMLNRIPVALALAAFILGSAAGLEYAESLEMIDPEASRRTMQVMFGLILAAYANIMPKESCGWRGSPRAASRLQRALRVGGWSLTLAGVVSAILWAFAPIAVADVASMIIVAAATTLTAAYGAWAHLARRRNGDNSLAH